MVFLGLNISQYCVEKYHFKSFIDCTLKPLISFNQTSGTELLNIT
jgi:hypothetical protein